MASKIAEAYVQLRAEFTQMMADFANAAGEVLSFWGSVGAGAAKAFQSGWSGIASLPSIFTDIGRTAADTFLEMGRNFASLFGPGSVMRVGLQNLIESFGYVGGIIADLGRTAGGVFLDLANNVISLIPARIRAWIPLWQSVMDTITTVGSATFSALGVSIVSAFNIAMTSSRVVITRVVPIIWNYYYGLFSRIGTFITTSIPQAMQAAVSGVQSALTTMYNASKNVFDSIYGMMRKAFSPAGTIGVDFTPKGLIALANYQQQQEIKLEGILRNTGNAAGFTAAQLKKMASEIQEVTVYGDEAVIRMQGLLATFGNVQGETFKRAVQAALNINTVFNQGKLGLGDLRTNAIQVAKALEDPVRGLAALRRIGMKFNFSDETAVRNLAKAGKLAEAQAAVLSLIEGRVGGIAQELAKTFGGRVQQMRNAMGDLGEAMGRTLIDILKPFIGILKTWAVEMQKFEAIWRVWSKRLATVISTVMESMSKPLKDIFSGTRQNLAGMIELFVRGIEVAARFVQENAEMVATITKVVAEIVAFRIAIFGSFTGLLVFKSIFMALIGPALALGPAILAIASAMTGPMGIALAAGIVGIAALGTALSHLLQDRSFLDKLMAIGDKLWRFVAKMAMAVGAALGLGDWDAFVGKTEIAITSVLDAMESVIDWLTANSDVIADWLMTAIGALRESIKIAIDVIVVLFDWLSEALGASQKQITGGITGTLTLVESLLADWFSWLGVSWSVLTTMLVGGLVGIQKIFLSFIGVVIGGWRAIFESGSQVVDWLDRSWGNLGTRIMSVFKGIAAGLSAMLRGKSPLAAFREAMANEMSKMEERMNNPAFDSAKIKSAFADSVKSWYDTKVFGEDFANNAITAGGKALNKLTEDAGKRADERRKKIEEINKRLASMGLPTLPTLTAPKVPGAPGGGAGAGGATPKGLPEGGKEKVDMIGLVDMWKKVQESVSGGSMISLTKGINENTGKMAASSASSAETLVSIDRRLANPTAATVAVG